jgi:hypothetical protein
MGRSGGVALCVIALLTCWLFSAALFSGKVLGGDDILLFAPPFHPPAGQVRPENPYLFDSAWVFHPDMLEARAQLRHFQLPIWTAYQGAGEPLLATQQAAAFFPLNWIADIFPFWQSLEWIAFLKLFLAGAGMLLFGRALGLSPLPSVFAAISFAFSTYMIGWLAHPHSNVYVLLPWLMLAGDRVAARGRPRDALLLAIAIALALVGGHPESALLVLLASVLWWSFRSVEVVRGDEPAPGGFRRRALLLTGAATLGAALAAIALIPFVEMLGQAQSASRSAGPGPWSIAQSFLMPERWGRPDKFTLPGGPMNYQERTAYFGALPLLLAPAGLIARPRRRQLFFFVLGVLALGLVVTIPLYSGLAASAPGLASIQRYRALSVCTFAGAVLAAFGLQAVLTATRQQRRLVLIATLAAAAASGLWVAGQVDWSGLGAAAAELPVLGDAPKPAHVAELAAALRWLVLAGAAVTLVALAVNRPRYATAAAGAAIALTAVDLVTLDRGYIPAIDAAAANPPAPAPVRYAWAHAGHERVGGGQGLEPNMAERFGLRGARIHALPALKRRNMLWFGLGGEGLEQRLTSAPRELAALFAVKYVFTGQRKLSDPQTRRVMPGLYENRGALPRAWVAYDWTAARGPDGALTRLARKSRREVLQSPVIEGVASRPVRRPTAQAEAAQFTEDGDRTVELRVDAKAPAYLVLADTYYPGWKATVDGHEADIKAANVAFRAVKLPAGRHVVRFEYKPTSVTIGLILSALAALVLIGGLVATRVRRAPSQPRQPE